MQGLCTSPLLLSGDSLPRERNRWLESLEFFFILLIDRVRIGEVFIPPTKAWLIMQGAAVYKRGDMTRPGVVDAQEISHGCAYGVVILPTQENFARLPTSPDGGSRLLYVCYPYARLFLLLYLVALSRELHCSLGPFGPRAIASPRLDTHVLADSRSVVRGGP